MQNFSEMEKKAKIRNCQGKKSKKKDTEILPQIEKKQNQKITPPPPGVKFGCLGLAAQKPILGGVLFDPQTGGH